MADAEPLSIRGIHWRDAVPFTHLFRAFRVAIHPSKIVLALAALLLLFVGGRVMDQVWPVGYRAVPGEVGLYEAFAAHAAAGQSFADVRRAARAEVESAYAARLLADKIVTDPAAAAAAARIGDRLSDLKQHVRARRDQAERDADAARKSALKASAAASDPAAARRSADDEYRAAVRAAYAAASDEYRADSLIKNQGLYDAFFDYEARQVRNAVQGVLGWNWWDAGDAEPEPGSNGAASTAGTGTAIAGPDGTLGLAEPPLPSAGGAGTAGLLVSGFPTLPRLVPASPAVDRASSPAAPALPLPSGGRRPAAIVPSIVRFFAVGPAWLLTQHAVYFTLFGLLFLFLWSVFGGAISRIAAVHVARDEKLSIRSALVFSGGKFLSFLCAPLIPLAMLAFVGLLTAAVSLLGCIPLVGPIILGLGLGAALLAGLVMAVIGVGLVGGFNLMYPTIAVEGSDSFDAMSRSFSYLYARPWRLAFYTAVSVVYGSACYLFVRLFIYLALWLTHTFVGLGVLTHADSTAPLLSALWPDPTTAGRLSFTVDSLSLTFPQEIGAGLIWCWVHLVVAVLAAFAICFYFSCNTIIYFLLRQEVDATDLNEVHVDPEDSDDADDEPDPADPPPRGRPTATSDVSSPVVVAPAGPAADAGPPT